METEKAKNLAEYIANFLQESGTKNDDFSSLHSSLEKINERLDKIESQLSHSNSNIAHHSSLITHHLTNHPSQHKFEIPDAVAFETSENFETEKACPYEPAGKPCDHCAMCSSRGF